MDLVLQYKNDIAVLLMRMIVGILFLMQGYDKIFGMGLKKTEEGMEDAMRVTHLPKSVIDGITVFSSFLELTGALMLICGFWIYPALLLLSFDLLIVVFGMSLRQPLWDMRFVWPRLVLVVALLILPAEYDRFSLDHLLHMYGNNIIAR